MKKTALCAVCSTSFEFYPTNRPSVKYCSVICRVRSSRFWVNANDCQKLGRIKNVFERYIVRGEDCWGWNASVDKGYGHIKIGSKKLRLHRASWMLHVGEIPSGSDVKHSCGNKICANPKHLFLTDAVEHSDANVLCGITSM